MSGLAVNPMKGLVAWIDVTERDHRIMVANMDGSGVSKEKELEWSEG